MNKFGLTINITILCVTLSLDLLAQDTIEDLQWLNGSWKRINANTIQSWEIWQHHEGGLSGYGFNLNNGDTVFTEKLSIVQNKDGLFYIADVPHNQTSIYFKLTKFERDSWLFENPDHDFPNTIAYRKINGSTMHCTIEGKGKQIVFKFVREEQ